MQAKNTSTNFSEIQESPKVRNSLRYSNEATIQYQLVCADSLLVIAIHSGSSFLSGKVDLLNCYPLFFF